jgi:hypothetical protein
MPDNLGQPRRSIRTDPLAAILSALVPGLGQVWKGDLRQGGLVVLLGATLLGLIWGLARAMGPPQGRVAATFLLILVVLPCWVIQSYHAFLPVAHRGGWGHTMRTIWTRADDIRYLGALFLLSAVMDLYIIITNPDYALPVFCTRPTGVLGLLAKAQSPTLHTLIGYGFIRLHRWALLLYLAYAAYGLANVTVNFACFGYGLVRTVFLFTLIGFTAYVLWRRACFRPARPADQPL